MLFATVFTYKLYEYNYMFHDPIEITSYNILVFSFKFIWEFLSLFCLWKFERTSHQPISVAKFG
jgi:hypothetical protein